MRIAQVKFMSWDRFYFFDIDNFDVLINDYVVAKSDFGLDVGRVTAIYNERSQIKTTQEIIPITRKVTTEDLDKISEYNQKKSEAIEFCKKAAERRQLPMKIVDAHSSLDGGRLIFAFIADGRIDFRDLVKDLTHHFQKSIRLHQLGIRDEAKICGDIGPCGRRLCCISHLKELTSITSDLADLQQVAHRGPERLSGVCGRLRCCLAYEKIVYEELSRGLPELDSFYKTSKGQGRVISRNILKRTIDVAVDDDKSNIVEVKIK